MELQTTIYLVVGLSFALYIGIAIWARAGSTSEFYVAGGGVRKAGDAEHKRDRECRQREKHSDHDAVDHGNGDRDQVHRRAFLCRQLAGDGLLQDELAVPNVGDPEIGNGLAVLAEVETGRGALIVDLLAILQQVAALGEATDLGPAAAFSLMYFLVILLVSWVFYTVMTNLDRAQEETR